jgi:alpha-glucoside transport system substrate-binding protein
MTTSRLRVTALLTLAALATSLASCSAPAPVRTVTVLGLWSDTGPGSEGYAFRQVLKKFEVEYGIRVNYQYTRALLQVLASDVQAGTPPDVAILPSVGELARYARGGDLLPLDRIVPADRQAAFPRPWLLPLPDNGSVRIHAIPVKASLKSLVWYNLAHQPPSMPRTWEGLVAYTQSVLAAGGTPWCLGMADPPSSGWPGTDLIEDILLHQSGREFYRRWAAGTQRWNSGQVKDAWQKFGALVTRPGQVRGGPHAVLLTDFQDAGRPLFDSTPGCFLDHEASFIMGVYKTYQKKSLEPGTDFDFFPFPSLDGRAGGGLWEASADLAGMFRDTPQAGRLMSFLASDEVQRIWAYYVKGDFSVNKHADLSLYEDSVSKRIAQTLATETLCFDASDVMPARMRKAFYQAVLEYLNDPDRLQDLLDDLEQTRQEISREDWVSLPCGR